MAKTASRQFFGLVLPEAAREKLRRAGIFVQMAVTVEHQNLARCYVVRGVESGGAVEDFGHYVTFAAEDGSAVPYLCRVESLAVNGPHAVVVAPSLVRAEMLRVGNTYELLVTRHRLNSSANGKRPTVAGETIFRGVHGYLATGATGLPAFLTRAGEPHLVPQPFVAVTLSLTAAVGCIGCEHPHYLVAATGEDRETGTKSGIQVATSAANQCPAVIGGAMPETAV